MDDVAVIDALRLAIVPADPVAGGFAVEVHVNGPELTSLGAGLGMDPYELLNPATKQPRDVPPEITTASWRPEPL